MTWTDLGAIASSSIFTSCFLGHGVVLIGDNNGHIVRSTSAFGLGDFNPYEREFSLQFGCLGAITPNGTSYLTPGNGATQTNEIRIRVPRIGVPATCTYGSASHPARLAARISTPSA